MKKSIAKKWVKALRSGAYQQGTYQLVDENDNFCCLGVLCNLAVDEGIGEWVRGSGGWVFKTEGDVDDQVLPLEVRLWAGMSSTAGRIDGNINNQFELCTLVVLNDAGESFKELASIIEKNVEKL
jgi:hypothetical protein